MKPRDRQGPKKAAKPLQNVKTRGLKPVKKPALTAAPKLARTTFRTSRELDFFNKKELITQTGHAVEEWPQVFIKELIDNSLDACEEADISPVITVTADAAGISVKDDGPGLRESTLKGAMDFTIRASNREAYVAPDRGAQGNALKTLLPMAGVLDPKHGKFIVAAHGKRHVITCGIDPISQRVAIHDDVSEQPTVGTEIRIEWRSRTTAQGDITWPFNEELNASEDFADLIHRLVEGFAILNPHATIHLNWFGCSTTWTATDPSWLKWKPNRPTSAHWYEVPHLERLIGAYITHDRDAGNDRLVSELVPEFDGLSGSKKRSDVLRETGLHRVRLSELVAGDRLDSDRISQLLASMQQHTRPINPKLLGIIGEEHLRTRLLALGVKPESFRYCRKLSKSKKSQATIGEKASSIDNIPWVLESAFGWRCNQAGDSRRIYAGANWSAAINNPFRTFGATGEGLEATLSEMKAGAHEPIVFVLHLAHPRIEYTDRGKSALVIGGPA
jgi:DNA topoisomerase VI subunit B